MCKQNFANRLTDLVFPERCVSCHRIGSELWCAACRAEMEELLPPFCEICGAPGEESHCGRCRQTMPCFDQARSAYVYHGTLRSAIISYKYRGYRRLAPMLGGLLSSLVSDAAARGGDALVAIPSEPVRRWRRGFSPAELIARGVAADSGLPLLENLLQRRPFGKPQVGLNHRERARNVAGRFRVILPAELQDHTLILIDDIMTTGATCSEAARVLKAAGALAVYAITVGRG